jgi:hypothetical protein
LEFVHGARSCLIMTTCGSGYALLFMVCSKFDFFANVYQGEYKILRLIASAYRPNPAPRKFWIISPKLFLWPREKTFPRRQQRVCHL